jgi:hypothetical protein
MAGELADPIGHRETRVPQLLVHFWVDTPQVLSFFGFGGEVVEVF